MSTQYKKFLRLLEHWPADSTKPGRDLGEYLRKQLKASLRAGDISTEGGLSVDRQFLALERICNNTTFNQYPRSRQSSSTGLSCEHCTIILAETSLKYFSEQQQGLFAKTKQLFFNKNSDK